jgi:hypothetical protein
VCEQYELYISEVDDGRVEMEYRIHRGITVGDGVGVIMFLAE